MITTSPLFRAATAAVAPIVDVETDPTSETPCPHWSYADLLGHLVGGDQFFHAVLTGLSAPPSPEPACPTPDDYRAAGARLADDFDDPAVLAGTYDLPAGRLAGPQVVLLRAVEHVLHGWDLARSAGAPTSTLEPVAEAVLQPALLLLAAVDADLPPGRRPFAAPVPVADDATAVDRLVGAFGRDPSWLPDASAGYAAIKEHFAAFADVERPDGSRRGYGAEGLRVDGQVFACPHRGRLMVKLPADEVTALIDAGLGLPLAKPGQRPMREWALVPFDGAARRRAERAYTHVRGRH